MWRQLVRDFSGFVPVFNKDFRKWQQKHESGRDILFFLMYPEGRLDDPAIVAQIHLTRQSLVFGSNSLLNRIRRSLWVRQQLEAQAIPRKEWNCKITELEAQCAVEYTTIPLKACDEYVTLLNLRDHAEINGMALTEQIYVHSKLTIVDDRYVLVGSANINDRSLLGDRDSELAVLISDTGHSYVDLDGSGTAVPCRNFARELRQKAWRKWMGSAAGECAEALDKPALPASWEKIQSLAKKNTKIYEHAFNFIPRDNYEESRGDYESYGEDDASEEGVRTRASIWAVVAVNTLAKNDNMPFSIVFWKKYNTQNEKLKNIKGFFHSNPIHWTESENNLIEYNMRLIARYTQQNKDNVLASNNDSHVQNGVV